MRAAIRRAVGRWQNEQAAVTETAAIAVDTTTRLNSPDWGGPSCHFTFMIGGPTGTTQQTGVQDSNSAKDLSIARPLLDSASLDPAEVGPSAVYRLSTSNEEVVANEGQEMQGFAHHDEAAAQEQATLQKVASIKVDGPCPQNRAFMAEGGNGVVPLAATICGEGEHAILTETAFTQISLNGVSVELSGLLRDDSAQGKFFANTSKSTSAPRPCDAFSCPLGKDADGHADLLHPQLPLVTAAEYPRGETTSQIKNANCAIAAPQAQTSQLSALSLKCPKPVAPPTSTIVTLPGCHQGTPTASLSKTRSNPATPRMTPPISESPKRSMPATSVVVRAPLSARASKVAKGAQLPGVLFDGIAPLTTQAPNTSSGSIFPERDDAELTAHGARRADHACETQFSDRSGSSEKWSGPPKQSVSQRAQAYEAACKAKVAPARCPEPVPRRLLATTKTRPLSQPSKPLQRPLRTLSAVTEQRVLKTGIVCLCRALVDRQDVRVIDLPKCASGAPKVLQGAAFLQRLLNDEVELKSCMESDVCAAQADVKYLKVEQLLSIREHTLDLMTESQSHSARNSFLETIDKYLFSALASRCMQGGTPQAASMEPLHQLGLRIALTVGVVDMLKEGWGLRSTAVAQGECPQLPSHWAIRLKPQEWPGQFACALLHVDELRVHAFASGTLDVAAVVGGNPVAAVRDRTSGVGKDRMLHWEVLRLECKKGEDFLTLLDRETIPRQQSGLVDELSAKLLHRATRTVA